MSNFKTHWARDFLAMLLLVLVSVHGQQPERQARFTKVGAWPDFRRAGSRDVVVSGNYAYVAADVAGLKVFDIRDPANPRQIGGCATADSAQSLAVAGNYLYLTAGFAGVEVIDISDPARPERLRSIPSYYTTCIAVSGNYAYLGTHEGFKVLDITFPANPIVVGQLEDINGILDLAVSGNHVYAAWALQGLQVIDVSDPANPRLEASTAAGFAFRIAVEGSLAYIADIQMGLRVLDISNPKAPTPVGSLAIGAADVAIVGNFAYVVAARSGLQIIDISRPASPELVGADTKVWSAENVAVSGNFAYVTDSNDALKILDISQPANPRRVGGAGPVGLTQEVRISGRYAYLAEGMGGLQVIDVENPARPERVGGVTVGKPVYHLELSGHYALLANYENGLTVVDIANPLDPRRVADLELPRGARGLAVSGDFAYVAAGFGGLHVVDIANPAAPRVLGSHAPSDFAYDVVASGNYAYTANSVGGVEVFDVSDPAAPRLVTSMATGRQALNVSLFGNMLYVGMLDGFWVFDVSDPERPKGVAIGSGYGSSVTQSGNHIFVGGTGGLTVYDVSNPAVLRWRGSASFPWAGGVTVVGNRVYAATGNDGLQILDLRFGLAQTIDFQLPFHVGVEDGPITLAAQASSGLPINYSVVKGPATVSGNQLELTGPGPVVIRAEQLGNAEYLPAVQERDILAFLPQLSTTARGAWPAFPRGSVYSVAALGNYAFFGVRAGVLVADIAQPGDPKVIATFDMRSPALDFAVLGNFVYATSQSELCIVDMTNPTQPVATKFTDVGGYAIAARGDHVYVGGRTMDVTERMHPQLVGTFIEAGPISQMAFAGNHLMVAGDTLRIFNVTDPASPQLVTSYNDGSSRFAISGNHVFLVNWSDALRVLDISDPANPRLLAGSFRTEPGNFIQSIAVAGNRAFFTEGPSDNTYKLRILDISSPTNPQLLGSFAFSGGQGHSITISGNYALITYVANADFGRPEFGGYEIIDISNSASPQRVSFLPPAEVAHEIAFSGNFAFVAQGSSGLQVLDITDPAVPRRVANYQASGRVDDVVVNGNRACVLTGNSLDILDITNPANPQRLGTAPTLVQPYDLAVSGNYALVLGGDVAGPNSVRVFDISDAANPRMVGNVTVAGVAMVAAGNYVYVAVGAGGLRIVDISDPSKPAVIGACTDVRVYNLAVSGNYAYVVGDGSSVIGDGTSVIDISVPSRPRVVASAPRDETSAWDKMIEISGKYAFVSVDFTEEGTLEQKNGIQILDISNPLNPHRMGFIDDNEPGRVRVRGNHIYMADNNAGLKIFEFTVADPRVRIQNVAGETEFRWITEDSGFKLQQSVRLGPLAEWTDMQGTPTPLNSGYMLRLPPASQASSFYRLIKR